MTGYNHSTTHNYPNEHKTHHENKYSDITITDTEIHPDKDVDVTFHSAVGNSLVLNFTRDELTEFVNKANAYLTKDDSANNSENYSYCLDASKIREQINDIIFKDDAGLLFISEEAKRASEEFLMLDEEVQESIAAQALYQVVEIDDAELRALSNAAINDATHRVIDYINNHNV